MAFDTEYLHEECGSIFRVLTEFDPRKAQGYRVPRCPRCKEAKRRTRVAPKNKSRIVVSGDVKKYAERKDDRMQDMIAAGKPPSSGPSARSRAFDATAEIVMEDYGMTNIDMNSNLREGDNSVPKLRPDLEKQVDSVFKSQGNKVIGMGGSSQLNTAITNQINSGMFKGYGDVVQRQQESGIRVPVNVIAEHSKQPG